MKILYLLIQMSIANIFNNSELQQLPTKELIWMAHAFHFKQPMEISE